MMKTEKTGKKRTNAEIVESESKERKDKENWKPLDTRVKSKGVEERRERKLDRVIGKSFYKKWKAAENSVASWLCTFNWRIFYVVTVF